MYSPTSGTRHARVLFLLSSSLETLGKDGSWLKHERRVGRRHQYAAVEWSDGMTEISSLIRLNARTAHNGESPVILMATLFMNSPTIRR